MRNQRVHGDYWANYLLKFYQRIPEFNQSNFDRNVRGVTIRVDNNMPYAGLYDSMYNEVLVNNDDLRDNNISPTRLFAHEFLHMSAANRNTLYNGEKFKKCSMGLCKFGIQKEDGRQPTLAYDFGGALDEGMTEEMVKRAGLFDTHKFYPDYQNIVTALDDLILDGEASLAYFDGGFDRIYNAIAGKVDGGQERLGHIVAHLDQNHMDTNIEKKPNSRQKSTGLIRRSINDVVDMYHARAMDINDWHFGIDYLRDSFGPLRRIDTVEAAIKKGRAPRKKSQNIEFVKNFEKSL